MFSRSWLDDGHSPRTSLDASMVSDTHEFLFTNYALGPIPDPLSFAHMPHPAT